MLFKTSKQGKAILGRPFLFSMIILMSLGIDLSAQDLPIIRKEGPTVYILEIGVDSPERSRAWDSCRAFSSRLEYPGKVENNANLDESLARISAQFGFYLYRQMAFLKQVDGAIFADLEIEFQQDQVLAEIRNIYYMDYARDRYGKFSPKSSKKYSLETLNKKRASDTWQKHLNTIDNKMRLLLSNLSKSIVEINAVSVK